MTIPYLAYFNDCLVGVVPLSGKLSNDRTDREEGTRLLVNVMGFDSKYEYLAFLPGYSMECNPLKEYETDILFLAIKHKIGNHSMLVNFTNNAYNYNTFEFLVGVYNGTKSWVDAMIYAQPKMKEVWWYPTGDELWYCSDWEG